MKAGEFAVVFQEKGKRPSIAIVGSGATVRSALRAVKLDPEANIGSVTLNGKAANLGDRLKTNDLLAVTPNTAGGSR